MGVIVTGSYAKALWPGVKAWFGTAYDEYEKEYPGMYDVMTSDKNFEELVSASPLGLAPLKPEGQNIEYSDMQQLYLKRFVHAVNATGFIISREAIEDNLYMELAQQRSEQMGLSVNRTLDTLGAAIYNTASTSSTSADGSNILSTHTLAKAFGSGATTTYSNLAAAVPFSEVAIENMLNTIGYMLDDAGLPVKVLPEALIIPVALQFEAKRLLGSDYQYDTGNNAINAIKAGQGGGIPKVVISHYLNNSQLTSQYFIKTDIPNGMIMFMRRDPKQDMDTDFDSENVKFKTTVRTSFGCADWRGLVGSLG